MNLRPKDPLHFALNLFLGLIVVAAIISQLLVVTTLQNRHDCLLAQRREREEVVQRAAQAGQSAVEVQVRLLGLPQEACR
jgi:uncharacterized membrane protein